jgi:hypothetical protein
VTPAIVNIVAIVLTILVLSRIAGDNPLFRVAQYLFVGTSLGLAFVVVYHQVLAPAFTRLAVADTPALVLYGVPLALGVLLLPRITRRQELSWLANIPLALVFGVGAALAVGGAIIGTLLPQILDTARPPGAGLAQTVGALVLLLGTVVTLASFYYTVPRDTPAGRWVAVASAIGHWLLMVAFGAFFAAAVQTYISALTSVLERVLAFVGLAP